MKLPTVVVPVLCLCAACLSAPVDALEGRKIPWRNTTNLEVEMLGDPLGVPVLKLLPVMPTPKGEFVQPMWYRAPGRQIHFVTLNLATGVAKRFPVKGAHEIWATLVHDGKLYLGYNVPSHFGIYDPATDSLEVHGKVFKKAITLYRLRAGTDGTLVLAGANGSTEVATYDPKAGALVNHGGLSSGRHAYVYYVSMDENFIYGACRGKAPWHLIAKDRRTGMTEVIATTAVTNHMHINGNIATASDRKTATKTYWRLEYGQAVKLDGPPKPDPRPTSPKPAMPVVMYDPDAVYADGKVAIRYRLPDAAPDAWETARLEVALESKSIQRIIQSDDTTIVGTSGDYGPMFRFDIPAGELKPLGAPSGNTYSIGKSGDKVYVCGYPSTWFDEVAPFEPFTPVRERPGVKAVKRDAANANPRRVGYLTHVKAMNSHQGVRLHTGPDGKVWIIGMRHRYYRGFALAWYDPATGQVGRAGDAGLLNHLQVSWSSVLADGNRLLISTWVQPDDQVTGAPPAAAKLLVFDMVQGKFVKDFTPFSSDRALGYVVQPPGGAVVGMITYTTYPDPPRSILYRFDVETGVVTQTREYEDTIGVAPAFNTIPRGGPGLRVGPDGKLYTLYRLGSLPGYPWLLIRIDPEDLSIAPVGRVGAGGRFIFVGNDIYLAGASQLRRVRDVVEAGP